MIQNKLKDIHAHYPINLLDLLFTVPFAGSSVTSSTALVISCSSTEDVDSPDELSSSVSTWAVDVLKFPMQIRRKWVDSLPINLLIIFITQ